MADYFEHTVIEQTIPESDMTPIERLLLSHIFGCEHDRDDWYFFAEQSLSTFAHFARATLEEALAASDPHQSTAYIFTAQQLAAADTDASEIELDFTGTSWEFIFQDIVRRSQTLRYISVLVAFTCSKMRSDGFGGMAILITPDRIAAKSTNDLIDDFLADAGLDASGEAKSSETVPALKHPE